MPNRASWSAIKRTKAILAYGEHHDQYSVADASGRRTGSTGVNVNYYSSDEDDLPGAYAVQRAGMDEVLQVVNDEEWDPTSQEAADANDDHTRNPFRSSETDLSVFDDESQLQNINLPEQRPTEITSQTFDSDVQVAAASTDTADPKKQVCSRKFCIITVSVLLIAGISAAFTAIVFSSSNKSDYPVESMVDSDSCDFSGQDTPDPFLQCDCFGSILQVGEDVQLEYQSIKTNGVLMGSDDSLLPPDSCAPENVALVWVAAEVVSLGKDSPSDEFIRNRFILAYLYAAWGGQDWERQNHWLSSKSECQWEGIHCENSRSVIRLSLPNNNLVGPLGDRIRLLRSLKYLDLSNNRIKGNVPEELWSLPGLEGINLGKNKGIRGTLPSTFGTNNAFVVLDFHETGLEGSLPASLEGLVNLRKLNMRNTGLTGSLPATLGGLTQLEYLTLAESQLSGTIPTSLSSLQQLRTLDIGLNRMSGAFPKWIGNLTALEVTRFDFNEFTGVLPTTIGMLSNLDTLDLLSNRLTGSIPSQLGNCRSLTDLNLGQNLISNTIPTELGRLGNLQEISFDGSRLLTGTVPSELALISGLQNIQIQDTGISPPVPPEICGAGTIVIVSSDDALSETDLFPGCSCCKQDGYVR